MISLEHITTLYNYLNGVHRIAWFEHNTIKTDQNCILNNNILTDRLSHPNIHSEISDLFPHYICKVLVRTELR